jgi:hypothetical protein
MFVARVTFAGNSSPDEKDFDTRRRRRFGVLGRRRNRGECGDPVGLWKTVDDKTGKARSHVRIVERNGILTGRIEDILDAGKRDARCIECEGAQKDQPVRGMVIIDGIRLNPKSGYWDSGTILDPNDGKVYREIATDAEVRRGAAQGSWVRRPLLSQPTVGPFE